MTVVLSGDDQRRYVLPRQALRVLPSGNALADVCRECWPKIEKEVER